MNRRSVLLGAGAALSLGLGSRRRDVPQRLAIKMWVTEEATAYEGCRARAASYLRRALRPTGHDIEVIFAESPQSFSATDRVVERRDWPARVLAGLAGLSSVDPVRDVNLLLTDGQVTGTTAGYAYDHVATVPGAEFLAEMPVDDPVKTEFDYSVPGAVTQLLLHEVGHALGLHHDHGSVTTDGSGTTVSPMVSGYAWATDAVRRKRIDDRICGDEGPSTEGRERRLSMQYSPCAVETLRSYRGGLPV